MSSNKTIDSDAVGSVIYFPYRKTIVPITSSGCDDRYGIGVSGYDTSTVPGSWIPNGKIPMLVAKNGDVYNNETSGFSANGIGNELYINTGIMFQCGKNSDATIFSKINPSSASPKWVTQPKMPIYGYNADHYDEPENKQTSYLTSANNGSDIYVFNYSHRGDPYSNENDEEDFLWKVLKYSYISK